MEYKETSQALEIAPRYRIDDLKDENTHNAPAIELMFKINSLIGIQNEDILSANQEMEAANEEQIKREIDSVTKDCDNISNILNRNENERFLFSNWLFNYYSCPHSNSLFEALSKLIEIWTRRNEKIEKCFVSIDFITTVFGVLEQEIPIELENSLTGILYNISNDNPEPANFIAQSESMQRALLCTLHPAFHEKTNNIIGIYANMVKHGIGAIELYVPLFDFMIDNDFIYSMNAWIFMERFVNFSEEFFMYYTSRIEIGMLSTNFSSFANKECALEIMAMIFENSEDCDEELDDSFDATTVYSNVLNSDKLAIKFTDFLKRALPKMNAMAIATMEIIDHVYSGLIELLPKRSMELATAIVDVIPVLMECMESIDFEKIIDEKALQNIINLVESDNANIVKSALHCLICLVDYGIKRMSKDFKGTDNFWHLLNFYLDSEETHSIMEALLEDNEDEEIAEKADTLHDMIEDFAGRIQEMKCEQEPL